MWSTYNSPILANNNEDCNAVFSDLGNTLEHLKSANCTFKIKKSYK